MTIHSLKTYTPLKLITNIIMNSTTNSDDDNIYLWDIINEKYFPYKSDQEKYKYLTITSRKFGGYTMRFLLFKNITYYFIMMINDLYWKQKKTSISQKIYPMSKV